MIKIFQINKPTGLLTIFSSGEVDFRDIKDDGSVGPSKPVYESTVQEVFRNIKTEKSTSKIKQVNGFIPDKLIAMNNESNCYSWKCKAGVRKLHHTDDKVSGEYALPNLVFKLNRESLYVVAVKDFKEESICYKPPFVNMYGGGSVCMGTAKIKYKSFTDVVKLIEHAESVFFNSMFSHPETEYMALGKGKKIFPENKLEPYSKKKLKDFIS